MYKLLSLITALLILMLPTIALSKTNQYKILISKKNNELIVEKAGKIVKKYRIASGKGGKGTKRQRGDSKTPTGVYYVSHFKENSRFYYFIQLSYPNLIDAWYGYKNKIIDTDDFKRITVAYQKNEPPPQDTKLGGFIGIHGLGDTDEKKMTIHQEFNWTNGCIALTNKEVNELRNFITIGTQVLIKE